MKAWFPAAVRFNIPYDTFWNLNPRIMEIYQDKYISQIEEQRDMMNLSAWLQGQYQVLAISTALNGKKCKYPDKPFELTGKSSGGLSQEENFLLWVNEYNRRFEISER